MLVDLLVPLNLNLSPLNFHPALLSVPLFVPLSHTPSVYLLHLSLSVSLYIYTIPYTSNPTLPLIFMSYFVSAVEITQGDIAVGMSYLLVHLSLPPFHPLFPLPLSHPFSISSLSLNSFVISLSLNLWLVSSLWYVYLSPSFLCPFPIPSLSLNSFVFCLSFNSFVVSLPPFHPLSLSLSLSL